jgi:hypothetical protein
LGISFVYGSLSILSAAVPVSLSLYYKASKKRTIPTGIGMTDSDVAYDDVRRYAAMMSKEADPVRRAELSKKHAEAFKIYTGSLKAAS